MRLATFIAAALLTGCQAKDVDHSAIIVNTFASLVVFFGVAAALVFAVAFIASHWRHFVCMAFRIPAHDPEDCMPSISATAWRREPYCPKCHSFTTDSESYIGICRSCGGGDVSRYYTRVFRKIWNGKRIVYQLENGKVFANIYRKPSA